MSIKFSERYDLSKHAAWKVGGVARYFVVANSVADISEAIVFARQEGLEYIIVGRTTNLLFADGFLDGVVIQVGRGFSWIEDIGGGIVEVGAGMYAPSVSRYCASKGYSGIEHISGIPASIGGLVVMNGGSLRKCLADSTVSVKSFKEGGGIIEREAGDCQFSYRESIYKHSSELVVSVRLKLSLAPVKAVRSKCLEIMRSRRKKFPLKLPNCGSVFKSSPDLYDRYGPPGKVLEDFGFKGASRGGAQISPMHANFIVNNGGALAEDILYLINSCRSEVESRTGIVLEPEVRYVDNFLKVHAI